MNWKHIGKSLAAGAVLLLGVGWGPMAAAQFTFTAGYDTETGGGTESGTTVTNTAQITSFTVATVEQVTVANQANFETTSDFVVDRRLNVFVTSNETDDERRVTNLETGVLLSYTVTNFSNAPINIRLRAVRDAIGAFPAGAPWNWITGADVEVCLDDGAGACDGAGATTFVLEDVAAGDSVDVLMTFPQVPDALDCNNVEDWHLVAAVANPSDVAFAGTFDTGAAGDLLTEDSNTFTSPDVVAVGTDDADVPGTIEDVFADGPGSIAHDFTGAADLAAATDAAAERQGQHAALVTLLPSLANMEISKSSRVVFDPVNGGFTTAALPALPFTTTLDVGANEPRRIPGAIIEYSILVTNDTLAGCPGGWTNALASAVTIEDTPPTNTVADAARPNVYLDSCDADGDFAAGAAVGTGFTQSVGDCDDSESGQIVFYVEIE